MAENLAHNITHQTWPGIFGEAWISAITSVNMVNGFAATGIHPFNPNAIPAHAFHLLLHHRLQEHKMMTRSHQTVFLLWKTTPQAPQVIPNTLDSVPVIENTLHAPQVIPNTLDSVPVVENTLHAPQVIPNTLDSVPVIQNTLQAPPMPYLHMHFRQCSYHAPQTAGTQNAMTRSHQTVFLSYSKTPYMHPKS